MGIFILKIQSRVTSGATVMSPPAGYSLHARYYPPPRDPLMEWLKGRYLDLSRNVITGQRFGILGGRDDALALDAFAKEAPSDAREVMYSMADAAFENLDLKIPYYIYVEVQ